MKGKTEIADNFFAETRPADSKVLSICLAYPNSRRIGLGNLGFHKIYDTLNRHPRVQADLFFWEGEEGSPMLSQNMGKELASFDIVAFSVTFEMDEPNLLRVLKAAQLGLKRDERGEGAPLICAGGVAVTLNPEPLSDFIDFLVIGEGEVHLAGLLDRLAESRDIPRHERLREIAGIEGVYVPSLYEAATGKDGLLKSFTPLYGAPPKVKRIYNVNYEDAGSSEVMERGNSIFEDTFLIETGKGCGQGCRFCAAGFIYRPTRHVKTDIINSQVMEGLERKGRIGLIGSAICEHPDILKIYGNIIAKGGGMTVSSLRAEYAGQEVFQMLAQGGSKTVTLAPETGTERLRKIINKSVTNEEIIRASGDAADAGILNLKLYFLYGLPWETDDDIAGIPALVEEVRKAFIEKSRRFGRAGKITVSISPFVPKPQTPFQWEAFADMPSLKKKAAVIRKGLGGKGNIELKVEGAKNAAVQALLSLGGRNTGNLLTAFVDGESWSNILKRPEAKAVYGRSKRMDEILPWDFIDSGVTKKYLIMEHGKAAQGRLTPNCPPARSGCRKCGIFEGVCF